MKWFLLLLCLFLCGRLQAQDRGRTGGKETEAIGVTKALVDRLFREHAKAHQLPAVAYAIVRGEGVVYSGGIGIAQADTRLEAGTQTVFRIASMTKSFTAMAILQLRDSGRLRLDDPVESYIPGLSLKQLSADAPRITIRHLLVHASGFPQDDPWADRLLAAHDSTLLRLANEAAPAFTTGTGYAYSNLGYALLGKVITQVAGMPYQEYIRRYILRPLGMHHTVWEFSHVPPGRLAKGYRTTAQGWLGEPLLHDGAFGAMGGLLTTIDNFALYMQLHMKAWPPRQGPEGGVLRRSSLREMHQGQQFATTNDGFRFGSGRRCATHTDYGFGLRRITDCEGRIFIGHSGGLPGFGSNWVFMPQYDLAVVSFSNSTYAPLSAINMSILDTIIRITGLQAREVETSSILVQRQKELVQHLSVPGGPGAEAVFAPNFFLDTPMPQWKSEARALLDRIGNIIEVKPVIHLNALRGEFIVRGSKGAARVLMSLSPEAVPRIQQVRITED